MKAWMCLLALVALMGSARAETLPSGDLSALASDGERLFVGSFDRGLFVSDRSGYRTVEFGVNPNINALAWDGVALWVGTARGVSRCQAQRDGGLACRRVGQSVATHALVVTRSGRVIAGGEHGLAVFEPSGESEREFAAKQRLPFRAVWSLAESDAGVLYVGTTSGVYWTATSALLRFQTPSFERASLISGELPDDWVTALLVERGALFVGTYNAGLVSFRTEGARLLPNESDTSLGYVNSAGIARLADGRLAVATMDGLRVGAPGHFETVATNARDVTALLPSTTPHSYWIATRRGLEQKKLEP